MRRLLPTSSFCEAIINAYRHSIAITFLAGAVVVCFALIVAIFLPERPLTKTLNTDDNGPIS